MAQFPQVLVNVKVRERVEPERRPADPRRDTTRSSRSSATRGRVVLRASGTEPVIRVMVEGEDRQQVGTVANRLADTVRETFGGS